MASKLDRHQLPMRPSGYGRPMANQTILQDRKDAGRRLAQKLTHLRDARPLVLGLPRGGIPVAFEISDALDAPLEPMFVKKIGAPHQKELAIGAVADGPRPELILNEHVADLIAASQDYIQAEMQRKLEEIAQRRRAYLGDRPSSDPSGRTVILVDDGIATGSSVKAALTVLRKAGPARLVLAVPVLPAQSIGTFERLVDELVYLAAPSPFHAVGEHYYDFTQVEDAEVVGLLAHSAPGTDKTRRHL